MKTISEKEMQRLEGFRQWSQQEMLEKHGCVLSDNDPDFIMDDTEDGIADWVGAGVMVVFFASLVYTFVTCI